MDTVKAEQCSERHGGDMGREICRPSQERDGDFAAGPEHKCRWIADCDRIHERLGTWCRGTVQRPSGAPDIFLPGVSAGNWVFAVGNDWDNAITRTPVSGQVLVHQRIDTQVGDTYWVQSTAAPSTADGLVDIHDTSPTADRWNYAAVEIVATRK